jgi:nitroreductase
MDVREALYTTRAMRRVKPDPIPQDVQARILDAAIRAPSGGNSQAWRFLLIDDPQIKAQLAPLYQDAISKLWDTFYAERLAQARSAPDDPDSKSLLQTQRSAQHLADNFEGVPLFLAAFARGDTSGGSIFPAVWSAQLAARAEGVGSALTSVLGGFHGAEAMAILGVPADKGWTMACLVSFGYPTGRWGVAARHPVHHVAYRNSWGNSVGFEVTEPLWPADQAS